jgi:hypothetical protein
MVAKGLKEQFKAKIEMAEQDYLNYSWVSCCLVYYEKEREKTHK